jgi:hypothetical protein
MKVSIMRGTQPRAMINSHMPQIKTYVLVGTFHVLRERGKGCQAICLLNGVIRVFIFEWVINIR